MVDQVVKPQFNLSPQGFSMGPPAKLVLKDATEFHGFSFGYSDESLSYDDPEFYDCTGEVVFSTAMVGYPDALTDPSFVGQLLTLTCPIIGNYGVPSDEIDEFGLPRWFESNKIHVRGLIICDYTDGHSHWASTRSLADWLKANKIPGIAGIDTRALTKHLRNKGTMLGRIIVGPAALKQTVPRLLSDESFYDPCKINILDQFVQDASLFIISTIDEHRFVSRYQFPKEHLLRHIQEEPKAFHRSDVKTVFSSWCVFDGYNAAKPIMGSIVDELETPMLVVVVNCGIKNNIIRHLLVWGKAGLRVLVVPYDIDFNAIPYDGLIITNGPGDPEMAVATIENVKQSLQKPNPIFGICLGHQILGLAIGARTYKMLYGNRGFNQPCIDLRTNKCYATSQNHGFVIDPDSLPSSWSTLFVNANDGSVEGIAHKTRPYIGTQFHPEGAGGPTDTTFLIKDFLFSVEHACALPLHIRRISSHLRWKRILLLSSGGLFIGQAGEFDYSGSQAIKALKEAGAQVILVNPNVATVQTNHGLADVVYFHPVTCELVSKIIKKERPDGIICSFGGQTGLNCGIELYKSGVLAKYKCEVLGTPIETIINTEDRGRFEKRMQEINERCAPSIVASCENDAILAAEKLGYPVLIRTNFCLGGFGSGFAHNQMELREILVKIYGIANASREDVRVYVDKALNGWKEVEFEIIRDINDNCIAPASMENFDPLGIHTGDSIVVAPAQTLNNTELYRLREVAFKIVRHLGLVGECNIQFAVNPENEEYYIVELNARLSRSSALASKATGYPLAYIAAKVALGYDLVQMRNSITLVTTACFEPCLDYIVVKVPKWDLRKFEFANNRLGSSMKSVGEVMSIGRTFEEAIQKALRMVDDGILGFESGLLHDSNLHEILDVLRNPTPERMSAIARAFELKMTIEEIHAVTKIDKWFLTKLANIHELSMMLSDLKSLGDLNMNLMRRFKCYGFSDKQIVKQMAKPGLTESMLREHRKRLGVMPFVKLIDTMAAEYPAKTNYCYLTYNGIEHDVEACKPLEESTHPSIIVLGCGPYRIGSSIEFDWSAVGCVKTLRSLGHAAIILNCNPETVSTDFDVSDRLYFDELSVEIIDAIYSIERPMGVVVSVGGQTANNLAGTIHHLGMNILGTSVDSIDKCESRKKFSEICDVLNIDQPVWQEFTSLQSANEFCKRVGFPVVARPSYVLSGASMRVIVSFEELEHYLSTSTVINSEHPVVISKFIKNAKEVEMDCVASQGRILNFAISEHVEYAGTHSGDATLILPAQNIFVGTHRRVKKITQKLSHHLNISGPFNVQFMCKNNEIKIIECNLRASRTMPFISKTLNVNFIDQATRAMVGAPTRIYDVKLMDLDYVAVKMPMFSFDRLYPADPLLGIEMKSTGEVAAFGVNKYEALLKAMIASGMKLPQKAIMVSLGSNMNKYLFAEKIQCLLMIGYDVYATEGTFNLITQCLQGTNVPLSAREMERQGSDSGMDSFISSNISMLLSSCLEDSISGIPKSINELNIQRGQFFKVYKPSQCDKNSPSALEMLNNGTVELFINVATCVNPVQNSDGYLMRRAAIDAKVALITTSKLSLVAIDALIMMRTMQMCGKEFFQTMCHSEYIS
ncbi:bifunctional Carbamoyl-phosphate synthetase [Babesia duncani]|uniref:Bifunctional Carbamoyl-phosphate synthetase n=1 Tax=Babesia duncani TaxID=323732 RepID=A0AAD9UPK2_9APIC|nr:bifunctional Carbamoyl-phosphate synthetase [Babesia duncani]